MKKHLLTTTALAACALLAGPGPALAQKASKPTLTVGGWVEGIFGGASQDDGKGVAGVSNDVGWDVQYDSEIIFKGQTTLDNGIRIRTVAELEGETSGDQFDEAWIAISGSFGEIRVGSEDNAAHLMVTPYSGSWATAVGQNLFFDTGDWITQPTGHAASRSTRLDLGANDHDVISYFTPRIEGIQLGATYIPSFDECRVSTTSNTTHDDCNGPIAQTSSNPHNGFALAANFDRKFDKMRVGLAAGYAQAKPTANAGTKGDLLGYSVAGSLEYAGFKVAAGYKQERNRGSSDNDVLDLGARYVWGKNAVSATYMHQEGRGSAIRPDDDKTDRYLISYRRTLGPGVKYTLNFFYADYQGQDPGSTDDNEGYAISTSVRVDF